MDDREGWRVRVRDIRAELLETELIMDLALNNLQKCHKTQLTNQLKCWGVLSQFNFGDLTRTGAFSVPESYISLFDRKYEYLSIYLSHSIYMDVSICMNDFICLEKYWRAKMTVVYRAVHKEHVVCWANHLLCILPLRLANKEQFTYVQWHINKVQIYLSINLSIYFFFLVSFIRGFISKFIHSLFLVLFILSHLISRFLSFFLSLYFSLSFRVLINGKSKYALKLNVDFNFIFVF